ncbi:MULTISPECIES: hypothetical protein [unclassified Moorena]|uniref:hypothetical protein n=1 Tax=unclassified Moorena TaxID=2683338 RepID=UPI0013CD95CC|nr:MULTISPECIES: hypothetical protein [unclassified Moorena]NEP33166.1 hypothetical protein [Moorena sp. SIO3B2]NES41775.1 hypothetical protein [Moorena sp. SIO2C4]
MAHWAPVIIAFPLGNLDSDNFLELVKIVYSKARDQVCKTLDILIDQENQQFDSISRIRIFKKCWDKHLSDFILEKAQNKSIKPNCMGDLLEELIKHSSNESKEKAREYLQTLSSLPLPLKKDERDRVMIALTLLFRYPTADRWSSIWSILEQEPNLGRDLIESVAYRYYSFPGHLELNLNEKQLADLYMWLVRQYPYHEDPDHSNGVRYNVSPRDKVARLRDDILRQLENFGTPQACDQLERIFGKFPELRWLKQRLISARDTMRRKTWNALEPKDVIKTILYHDPIVSKTVGDNQSTYNIDLYNEGGNVSIGGKDITNMVKKKTFNTDGGDVITNSNNKNRGSVNNSKTITTNKIGKGKRNTIKVTDPKTNPSSGDLWNKILGIMTIVGVVAGVIGLFGNGIFNEQIKRFLGIDQQPSLSPTPTVPSPSSTPDSE